MNAATNTNINTNGPDIATILEQCTNAMMAGQKQQQERQQQFESTANMAATQTQLANAEEQQQQMANVAAKQNAMAQTLQQKTTNMANANNNMKTAGGTWQAQVW